MCVCFRCVCKSTASCVQMTCEPGQRLRVIEPATGHPGSCCDKVQCVNSKCSCSFQVFSCPHTVMCSRVLTQLCVLVSSHSHVFSCPHTIMCSRVLTQSCVLVSSHSHVFSCPHTVMCSRVLIQSVLWGAVVAR